MALSKAHKVLFAVLALAVAVLLIDWLFLRGDATRPSEARGSVSGAPGRNRRTATSVARATRCGRRKARCRRADAGRQVADGGPDPWPGPDRHAGSVYAIRRLVIGT